MQQQYLDLSKNLEEKQKIELFLQCRSLKDMDTFSKSDPQVILYLKNSILENWVEFGKTEIICDNLNPNFVKTFTIEYQFEKQQFLKFKVIDIDNEKKFKYDFIGECETTLGNIVGSQNQTQVLQLKDEKQKNSGKLICRAQQVMQCQEYLNIQFEGTKIKNTHFSPSFLFGKTCPFLRFYKVCENSPPLLIYQTEVIKNSLKPLFSPKSINLGKLTNGDMDSPIICELWDYKKNGSHKNMGSFRFTPETITKEPNRQYAVLNNKGKIKGYFKPTIDSKIENKPNFLDFIKGGTQLALVTAIDFTASNGDPDMKNSLHYFSIDNNQQKLNNYQEAMKAVGEILLQYDHDKLVPVYGFGAKPQFQNLVSDKVMHCFPLTGNQQDAEVFEVQGMLDIYQQALTRVIFSGPTLFAPLLRQMMKVCQKAKNNQLLDKNDDQYFILLILTDGEIQDMQETIRCIVQSSHLPYSIIIIGIGTADFTKMEILDGDDGLWDSDGNKAQRDLVQFVPFNKYKGNPTILAEQVLEELPQQLEEYMRLVNRLPNKPLQTQSLYIPKNPQLQQQRQCSLNMQQSLQFQNQISQPATQQQWNQQNLQQYPLVENINIQNQQPQDHSQFQQNMSVKPNTIVAQSNIQQGQLF